MTLKKGIIAYAIGDYLLDVWQEVIAAKIAPDAPAPVWEHARDPVVLPGGAGNVARQFRHLSPDVTLVTVGLDAANDFGLKVLSFGSRCSPVVKTRFFQAGHVLARLDDVRPDPVALSPRERVVRSEGVIRKFQDDLEKRGVRNGVAADGRRVVAVLSDYASGFWTRKAAICAVAVCRMAGVHCVVDPKPRGESLEAWEGASVLKLNEAEALAYAGHISRDVETLHRAGELIALTVGCPVVITRSGRAPFVSHAHDTDQFGDDFTDPRPLWASGAGDCFAAHLAAGIGRLFLPMRDVLKEVVPLAHAAASVYVQKQFNEPVHPREAAELAGLPGAKIYGDFDELSARLDALPEGTRIGFTNGVFDLLHPGHISLLRFARSQCDFLVVFVNADASVLNNRGQMPIMKANERVAMLAALDVVGAVVPFYEPTPTRAFMETGRCHVLIKGEEYRGREIPGDEYADRVAFAPQTVPTHSTDIRRRVLDRGAPLDLLGEACRVQVKPGEEYNRGQDEKKDSPS